MIFLEYIGSRASLSARLIKLSPVKLRFYGTFFMSTKKTDSIDSFLQKQMLSFFCV